MKIAPYAQLYQRQIQYYNKTAYDTLANDIGKILPKFPTDKRQKCGAILTTILGSVASKVIGLAYEGISSFLHHKRPQGPTQSRISNEQKIKTYSITKYII